MSGFLERLFGGGQSVPSEYYPGGEAIPQQPFDVGPPVPARQASQGAFGTLLPEQRTILGLAALQDAFASLGGRPAQGFASVAPIVQMIGEQGQQERFRQANQQLRQQLFGGQAQAAAPLTPTQTQIVGEPGQVGFSPAGLAINTRLESGGRPDARSATSSALGPNQFTEGTFLDFAAANPNLFPNMSREQILRERTSPEISGLATQWYARRNASVLQNAGLPVTDATLGLAHQFDGPVAARILQAAPETPIADIVGPRAVAANRQQLEGRTVGEVRESFIRAYAGAPQQGGQPGVPQVPGAAVMPSQRRPPISMQEFDMIANLLPPGPANQAIIQAMMRQAPAPIVIEGTAYDPITLRPLVTAPQRPGEAERFFEERRRLAAIPPDQRTAQQNDELDILNARLRGSGTNVNVNTERTLGSELAKATSDELTKLRTAARTAPDLLLRTERINKLIDSGALTGTGANFFSSVANALTTAGIIDPAAAANTQMLTAELRRQVLAAAENMPGSLSNADVLFLQQATAAGAEFNEQTIRQIANLYAKVAERSIREYNQVSSLLQDNPNISSEIRAVFRPIDYEAELERARTIAEGSVVRRGASRPGTQPTTGGVVPPPGAPVFPYDRRAR